MQRKPIRSSTLVSNHRAAPLHRVVAQLRRVGIHDEKGRSVRDGQAAASKRYIGSEESAEAEGGEGVSGVILIYVAFVSDRAAD